MKIVKKNRHLDAAIALLSSKSQAKDLLHTLQSRPIGSYSFYANQGDHIDIAVLTITNPGSTVTILSTTPLKDVEMERISSLIDSSVNELLDTGSRLAQTLFPIGQTRLEQVYETASFQRLAILNYMERSRSHTQITRNTPDHVRFIPMTEQTDAVLGTVLLETYEGSLDCPIIHGLRDIQDIIDGHRGNDHYDAQLWFIAEVENKSAGVLLLNHIQDLQCMELAYLGVAPWARTRGVGNALMQLAIEQSLARDVPRITLAVDAENTPAIHLYKKWNFHKKRQRVAMIRKLC